VIPNRQNFKIPEVLLQGETLKASRAYSRRPKRKKVELTYALQVGKGAHSLFNRALEMGPEK